MATVRSVLRDSKPPDRFLASSSSSSSSSFRFASPSCLSSTRTVECCSLRLGSDAQKPVLMERERASTVEVKACTSASENMVTREARDGRGLMELLLLLVTQVNDVVVTSLRQVVKRRPSKSQIQRFVESVIMDCRFFTIFSVVGTLVGSIPCFLQGCFLVMESYFHSFNRLSNGAEEHTVHLLIEAIDMFLLGTSMLVFGMGIYNMFIRSTTNIRNTRFLSISHLFGLFHLKKLPSWMEMGSISRAKSRIGYAVVMILHVGMLEKFKTTPLVTPLDLACFAASVLISSASTFLFSRSSRV